MLYMERRSRSLAKKAENERSSTHGRKNDGGRGKEGNIENRSTQLFPPSERSAE
jgi:hypothetical protein